MTDILTTRVWDCWDATYDALTAATFPAHPLTNKVPPVVFAGSRDVSKEMITVPGLKPPDGPTQDYATLGKVGRDEQFSLVIYLWSEVAGFVDKTRDGDPSRLVRQRIRDLVAVIENTFRDPATGRPQGITLLNVWAYAFTQTIPAVAAIEGGYGADVTMDLTFKARI